MTYEPRSQQIWRERSREGNKLGVSGKTANSQFVCSMVREKEGGWKNGRLEPYYLGSFGL